MFTRRTYLYSYLYTYSAFVSIYVLTPNQNPSTYRYTGVMMFSSHTIDIITFFLMMASSRAPLRLRCAARPILPLAGTPPATAPRRRPHLTRRRPRAARYVSLN